MKKTMLLYLFERIKPGQTFFLNSTLPDSPALLTIIRKTSGDESTVATINHRELIKAHSENILYKTTLIDNSDNILSGADAGKKLSEERPVLYKEFSFIQNSDVKPV
ncbi:MAG: hypothetical protein JXA66_06310 [Oligoflexia bacterium]|nr:hypothetical protein [Oligoflexia bacterium]